MQYDNRGAFSLLVESLPVARFLSTWQPFVYYQHLNSLAVELCALGRLEEAQRCIAVPLSSSVAKFSREWPETDAEIKARIRKSSRSKISIGSVAPQDETPQTTPAGERKGLADGSS